MVQKLTVLQIEWSLFRPTQNMQEQPVQMTKRGLLSILIILKHE